MFESVVTCPYLATQVPAWVVVAGLEVAVVVVLVM